MISHIACSFLLCSLDFVKIVFLFVKFIFFTIFVLSQFLDHHNLCFVKNSFFWHNLCFVLFDNVCLVTICVLFQLFLLKKFVTFYHTKVSVSSNLSFKKKNFVSKCVKDCRKIHTGERKNNCNNFTPPTCKYELIFPQNFHLVLIWVLSQSIFHHNLGFVINCVLSQFTFCNSLCFVLCFVKIVFCHNLCFATFCDLSLFVLSHNLFCHNLCFVTKFYYHYCHNW